MIYKVFYQESKISPRREQTRALYLDIDAASELKVVLSRVNWWKPTALNTTSNLSTSYQTIILNTRKSTQISKLRSFNPCHQSI